MAYRHERRGTGYGIEAREITGIIVGFIVIALLVAVSYVLGDYMYALGWGGIIMGLAVGSFAGYMYSALNRRRRYDYVVLTIALGYVVGAYLVELFLPEGQVLANMATASTAVSWIVYLLYFLVILALMGASFFYAKRTDLR